MGQASLNTEFVCYLVETKLPSNTAARLCQSHCPDHLPGPRSCLGHKDSPAEVQVCLCCFLCPPSTTWLAAPALRMLSFKKPLIASWRQQASTTVWSLHNTPHPRYTRMERDGDTISLLLHWERLRRPVSPSLDCRSPENRNSVPCEPAQKLMLRHGQEVMPAYSRKNSCTIRFCVILKLWVGVRGGQRARTPVDCCLQTADRLHLAPKKVGVLRGYESFPIVPNISFFFYKTKHVSAHKNVRWFLCSL